MSRHIGLCAAMCCSSVRVVPRVIDGGVDGGYMILHYSKTSSPYTDYGS